MSDLDGLQQRVGEWGADTFPHATDISIWRHLNDEVSDELLNGLVRRDVAEVAEEAADCLMLILHLAHRYDFSLMDEAEKKFAINQSRTWNTVTEAGYVKHDV